MGCGGKITSPEQAKNLHVSDPPQHSTEVGVPCAFLPPPGPGQSRAGEWLEWVTLVAGLQNKSCEEFDGTIRLANCQFVPSCTGGNGPGQPWTLPYHSFPALLGNQPHRGSMIFPNSLWGADAGWGAASLRSRVNRRPRPTCSTPVPVHVGSECQPHTPGPPGGSQPTSGRNLWGDPGGNQEQRAS